MNVSLRRCALAAVALGLAVLPEAARVEAGALSVGGPSVYTQVGLNPTGTAYDGALYDFGTDTVSATLQYEYVAPGASVTSYFDGSAEARATFGTLGVKAAASLVDYKPGTYQESEMPASIPFPAYALAGFTDTLTVEGGTGSGLLVFNFAVTGSVTNGAFMGNGVIPTLEVNGTRVTLTPLAFTGDGSAVSDPFAFTFGTPFDIQVEFLGNVFVLDYSATDPYTTAGTAEFLNSLKLEGIVATTSTGGPLTGVTITGASGTSYPVVPTAVPEPGSLSLLAMGLTCSLAMAWGRGRWRQAGRNRLSN
ncbi:MAG: hypothetical protein EHM42_04535 [Planctomycetaceae bacterium]|nr:MAG: hypothetical protein EHM42_04535 [Planctomycetaceae bacterium]